MTVRELSAAWRKMYGENFITEYSGLYKELKAKGEFVNIGEAGHINTLSGYGEWEQGYELLKKLTPNP
jgi:predicted alpha/beta hydrolase family esterase